MTRSVRVETLISLYPPLRFDSEHSKNSFKVFCDYYSTPRKLRIKGTEYYDNQYLSVRAERCTTSLYKKYFDRFVFFRKNDWLLRIVGDFKFPGVKKYVLTDHQGNRLDHTAAELQALWRDWLPEDLDLTVQTFFCSLSLAFCCSIRPVEIVWLLNGKPSARGRRLVSITHDSCEYLVEHGIFPSIDLDPTNTIDWVFSKNGIIDGYSDTPAARSLNYFTRLFVQHFRNDELGDLVWALAGIEALLVQGGRSSMGQLREKLSALFTNELNQAWLTEMTDKMYRFRSSMVHGDRQIRSAFRDNETEPSAQRFEEEYNSTRFAVGIHFLLLRFMIERDLSVLRFKTIAAN